MAKPHQVSELGIAHDRCVSWAKSGGDRGPTWPSTTPAFRPALTGGGRADFSPADWEIDRIVCALPPTNRLMIVTEYKERGTQPIKARRIGMLLDEYRSRKDGALWVVWSMLEAGSYRVR